VKKKYTLLDWVFVIVGFGWGLIAVFWAFVALSKAGVFQ